MSAPALFSAQTTRGEALASARAVLRAAGCEEAALEARILLMEAAGIDATALAIAPEAGLGAEAADRLSDWIVRRLAHEPVWRILGSREFWGLPFALSPATLVPRPDTESLVELALAQAGRLRPDPLILDLGTGTGCILVALLHELRRAQGIGTDLSSEAAAMARCNAETNGVGGRCAFLVAHWCAPLAGSFDLIVSNPPYIPAAEIAGLAPEVRDHDPRRALDGGAQGLDPYNEIFFSARRLLAPGGLVVVEFGIGQGEAVAAMAGEHGLSPLAQAKDIGGIVRAAAFAFPPPGQDRSVQAMRD